MLVNCVLPVAFREQRSSQLQSQLLRPTTVSNLLRMVSRGMKQLLIDNPGIAAQ
jgi:hypothetical protein